ncbi:MAG: thioredoxin-dependent thiol peroxidase [Rhodoglobus sp.]|nr:thioredoxin-dependent thiol peroxidase [Rhodoglobus sp.]
MTDRLDAGAVAPGFTLPDQHGAPVSLKDFLGRKVIIYFYPEAMTEGCTKQACDFRDNLNSLKSAGYAVIGISRDAPDKLAKFAAQERLNFTLLSDPDRAVHEAYGVWGEKQLYGKTVVGVIRSTFVLDEKGVITMPLYAVKATGHVAMLRKRLGLL